MMWLGMTAILLGIQTAAQTEISGRVVSAATGEPVGGAQVTIIPIAPAPGRIGTLVGSPGPDFGLAGPVPRIAGGPPRIPQSTTPNDGRFSFPNLTPGTYRVLATANGYVQTAYGQRSIYGSGTPLSVSAGQVLTDITIRLSPTGVVTGHILDDLGHPAIQAPVQLTRVFYGPEGKRLQSVASGYADDRGEYRLYGLSPGRYYLVAGNGAGPQRRPSEAVNANVLSFGYAQLFYPGVTDANDAAMLEVKAGTEVIADMRVSDQHTHRIRGRIIGPAGQPEADVNISLAYRNLNGGSGSFGLGRNYDPATGAFELQNVAPGDYILQASAQDRRPLPPPVSAADRQAREAALAVQARAEIPIRVADLDLDGLVVALTSGASLSGHLTIEGSLAGIPQLGAVHVNLRPMWNGFPNPAGPAPNPSGVAADGSFHIDNVRDTEYVVSVNGVPPNLYLKRAQISGQDVLGAPFILSTNAVGTLAVTLGANPGQLQGTVTDAQGRPATGSQVVLVPAQRSRTDLYKPASPDPNGHFAMTSIAPGDYKIFSWDAIAPFSYFDPDFMKMYESQGQIIHVDEGSSQTADLKALPVVD